MRIFFLSLIFLIAGCDSVAHEFNTESEPISALAIRSLSLNGRKASFSILCSIPTPCYKYQKKQVLENGINYAFTLYGVNTSSNCIQRLDTLTVNESYDFASSGLKNLRFYAGSGSIDTTILVP